MNDIQSPAEQSVGDEAVRADEVTTPEAQEETTPDTRAADEAAPEPGQEDGEAEEVKSRSQKRRQARREAMEQAMREADEAAALVRQANEALERIRKAGEGKAPPKQADFESYDDFILAQAIYAAKRASDDDRAEGYTAEQTAAEAAAKAARERAAEQIRQNFRESVEEAKTRIPDFEAVINDGGRYVSEALAEIIALSESPADLAYAVAKDHALAGKLSAMHPIEAAREIGRIEARLSAPKPRVQTNAPEPITPVKGRAGAGRDPGKMSPAEYDAWRAAGGTFTL